LSAAQRENLDAILRQSVFPAGADVSGQRRLLCELTSAQPPPVDVTLTAATLSGVRTAEITIDGIKPGHTVLYFRGGVYVLGDAFLAADLACQVARRTGANVIPELALETAGAVTLTVRDVVDWPVVAP
jgi:monoterpene epsilon-lactone hydrolase